MAGETMAVVRSKDLEEAEQGPDGSCRVEVAAGK